METEFNFKQIVMKNIFYFVLLFLLVTGCKKSELVQFDNTYSAVNFKPTNEERTNFYHFSFTTVIDSDHMVIEIPVRIAGMVSDQDRSFNVEVITSTTPPSNFAIIEGVVPANNYEGLLKVKIKNRPELRTTSDTLSIRIVKNEFFKEGAKELNIANITWNDQFVKFSNWFLHSMFTTPYYSPNLHRALVAATGEKDPSDIVKIVNKIYAGQLHTYLQQWKEDHDGEPLRHDANDGSVQCLGWEITTL